MKKENPYTYTCSGNGRARVVWRWQKRIEKAKEGGNGDAVGSGSSGGDGGEVRERESCHCHCFGCYRHIVKVYLSSRRYTLTHTHTHPFSLYLPSSLACYIGNWFCLQQYCVVVAVAVQRFLCADLALVHQILAMVYELHELTSHTHKFI